MLNIYVLCSRMINKVISKNNKLLIITFEKNGNVSLIRNKRFYGNFKIIF